MKFGISKLALKYCTGKGVEFGAAAHNPFGLSDCLNVAPKDDDEFYVKSQIEVCGESARIDFYADAEKTPFEDHAFDYVISSHVVEHVPDLIGAFLEWKRILKPGGIVFMIFPKRDALPADVGRPLSEVVEFDDVYQGKAPRPDGTGRHIWVFNLRSMIDLITHCNHAYGLGWEILQSEETDDKVGNGHLVVCKS